MLNFLPGGQKGFRHLLLLVAVILNLFQDLLQVGSFAFEGTGTGMNSI